MSTASVGWKNYPENLDVDIGESIWYNLSEEKSKLRSYAARLFVSDENKVAVKLFDYESKGGSV